MLKRKICIVSGTRAEYGLLFWLMRYINSMDSLDLQIIVTGMHLSKKFGNTYQEIERDGFIIDSKVNINLDSDKPEGILNSMGLGLTKFPIEYKKLNPDIIVVLGDRYEILCATVAAMIMRIPVAHLHGGEATEGLIDEPIRHSITKMSHLHFVSTVEYRDRVIQLGENPKSVFCVGGLGIDNILKLKLLNKFELEKELDLRFNEKKLLITFHPITLEKGTSIRHINELLSALDELEDTTLIFTMPNADTDSNIIFEKINLFVKNKKNAFSFISLGQLKYLSCLKYVDGVVGNSSSGLLEVPSFKKGTINIGDRQKGRIMASSVINCQPKRRPILDSINKLYSNKFKKKLGGTINPYGTGGASKEIAEILVNIDINNIIKKSFYNIKQ